MAKVSSIAGVDPFMAALCRSLVLPLPACQHNIAATIPGVLALKYTITRQYLVDLGFTFTPTLWALGFISKARTWEGEMAGFALKETRGPHDARNADAGTGCVCCKMEKMHFAPSNMKLGENEASCL